MEATLKGPYGQTNLEPTPYPYTIGRAPENLLVVNDPKVSSHHAQIRPEGQGYDIVDLGSSNGTFVNEQRLVPNVPRLLYTGDQVRIGDTVFVYEAGAMSQPFGESTVYGGFSQGSTLSYSPDRAQRYCWSIVARRNCLWRHRLCQSLDANQNLERLL
jgi:hypothetical protein